MFTTFMPSSPQKPKSTVSLVVAISGHRDLDPADFDAIQQKIEYILRDPRRSFDNETYAKHPYEHTDVLLLTGLAEGADRIGARAAQRAGVPYVAVLPMKSHLYRLDFETEESDREYKDLLRSAQYTVELPNCPGTTDEELAQRNHPKRVFQYEALARFITQNSQILIAVWDGSPEIKRGGTAHAIKLKLGEVTEFETHEALVMQRVGIGPVYILFSRRLRSNAPGEPGLDTELVSPNDVNRRSFFEGYRLMDRFNKDIVLGGKRLSRRAVESRERLFSEHTVRNLTEGMQWVAGVYSYADALADRFNAASWHRWQAVFVLLAVSGALLAFAHSAIFGVAPLLTYYVCLVMLAILMAYEKLGESRERHEDYRALAEALRVQFFWMAAGLSDLAADHYQTQQVGEMVWIRDAISECALFDVGKISRNEHYSEIEQTYKLAGIWIKSQKDYFQEKSLSLSRRRRVYHRISFAAATLGLVVPLAGFAVLRQRLPEWIEPCSSVAGATLMWWAALGWSYVERRGLGQLARQYARMYRVFASAEERLETFREQRRFEFCRQTIFELGRNSLAESGDWLALHRERKLSLTMIAG
jgi:hypothetical protein